MRCRFQLRLGNKGIIFRPQALGPAHATGGGKMPRQDLGGLSGPEFVGMNNLQDGYPPCRRGTGYAFYLSPPSLIERPARILRLGLCLAVPHQIEVHKLPRAKNFIASTQNRAQLKALRVTGYWLLVIRHFGCGENTGGQVTSNE
jgi:hypothetical protein